LGVEHGGLVDRDQGQEGVGPAVDGPEQSDVLPVQGECEAGLRNDVFRDQSDLWARHVCKEGERERGEGNEVQTGMGNNGTG
jgi:hypothetical protein